ncbi:MAG: hypothetical protein IK142_02655 [Clostridiales bacterium]|nr:hypothetical protein [Clostridiales bacterium]
MNIHYEAAAAPKCCRLDCFGNRGEGKCRVLRDTYLRGEKEGKACPFFKTIKESGMASLEDLLDEALR